MLGAPNKNTPHSCGAFAPDEYRRLEREKLHENDGKLKTAFLRGYGAVFDGPDTQQSRCVRKFRAFEYSAIYGVWP